MPSTAAALIMSFLARTLNEELPPPFLGPLAALVHSASATSRPTLYLLHENEATEFDGATAVDQTNDDGVVGIAYSMTTHRTSVHFWFYPKTSRDVANQSIVVLLHHIRQSQAAVLRLPGVELSHCTYINDAMSGVQWKRTNGYELHVLDPAVPVKATALGATWVVDGEAFELDAANPSDIGPILSLASVGYDPTYISDLLKHPIFSHLMRVVRVASTKQPVSWSLVHSDFSIGLLGTAPGYRRKGLVGVALGSTIAAYRAIGAADDTHWFGVQPHCFVLSTNTASQRLMASVGFKAVPNKTFHWMRVE